jgi:hypothetical protein
MMTVCLLPCMVLSFTAIAQEPPAPIAIFDVATRRSSEPYPISPGMLLSLHVRGIETEATLVPDGADLPTELSGIQVTYEDPEHGVPEPFPLPILRIDYGGGSCILVTTGSLRFIYRRRFFPLR